ncbi:hypothetical protein [Noviherbaspirillum sp. UKPF54]|uniref:hypothetical protein n=1 Tax=Noviherbaspirillum sp. UKPF54 TaxID=2601898 RepID=UPI0011B16187|nr:hypothetical protein [Noviherbaspirillum sp. UKPF54]QDZ26602.1 hypothetical protein FAY22_00630 [Noviherbaspirillum sp. UKPF54]
MNANKESSPYQAPALYLGRLMSPKEVLAATSDRTGIPHNVRRSWTLCGDVPETFWDTLKNDPRLVGLRASGFTTPSNTAYATFTVQVRDYQTRFLLPLGDEKVSTFIEDAQAGIWLSLGRNEGNDALLHQFVLTPAELAPLATISRRCRPPHWQYALAELEQVTCKALELDLIGSALPGFIVNHVAVNLVLSGA